jgi:hypothetical protein
MSFDFDAPVERAGSDSVKWAKYAGAILTSSRCGSPTWISRRRRRWSRPCAGASSTACSATTSPPRARSMPWSATSSGISAGASIPTGSSGCRGWCRASTSPAARWAIGRCRIHGDADLSALPRRRVDFGRRAGQCAAGARLGRLAVGFPRRRRGAGHQQGEALPACAIRTIRPGASGTRTSCGSSRCWRKSTTWSCVRTKSTTGWFCRRIAGTDFLPRSARNWRRAPSP